MNIKNLIIFLVIIYLINKVLEFILKKSEKVREESERKITMPALNSLSLYSYKDFKDIIKEYLLDCGFDIIDEHNELILVENEESEFLIYCKQVKEYTEILNIEEFYIFIAELNLRDIQQGMILTNGDIQENIKEKIKGGIKDFEIDCIDGNELVKRLRRVKEEKLCKGEI